MSALPPPDPTDQGKSNEEQPRESVLHQPVRPHHVVVALVALAAFVGVVVVANAYLRSEQESDPNETVAEGTEWPHPECPSLLSAATTANARIQAVLDDIYADDYAILSDEDYAALADSVIALHGQLTAAGLTEIADDARDFVREGESVAKGNSATSQLERLTWAFGGTGLYADVDAVCNAEAYEAEEQRLRDAEERRDDFLDNAP